MKMQRERNRPMRRTGARETRKTTHARARDFRQHGSLRGIKQKKVDYRLTTLDDDGLQSFATTSVKVHGFYTQLPLKRPHDNWFTRIKGADPRSKWILLEQTAHAGTMPCTDACTLHTRSCACSSRICRQASRLWQSGYAARRNCGFDCCCCYYCDDDYYDHYYDDYYDYHYYHDDYY